MKNQFTVFCLCVVLVIGLSAGKGWALDTKELEKTYPALKVFRDVELHGFVDTGYNFNFNVPDDQKTNFRIYDENADSFTLHLVELSVQKELKEKDYAGFRFDLHFGKDADINAAAGTRDDDQIDVEEAFLLLRCPLSGVEFKVGKFVTLMGNEVIGNPANWNYSRSFIFEYGPFTHTGVLASYSIADMVSITGGVVNGWDNLDDNNENKTFTGQIGFSSGDLFSLTVSGIYGSEQNWVNDFGTHANDIDADDSDPTISTPVDEADRTGLIGAVVTVSPMEQLTFVVDGIYGEQDDGAGKGDGAVWKAIAGYVRYDALDWLGFTTRYEYFSDDDGNRTGIDQELWSITFTTEFRPTEKVIVRVEYRRDESTKESFTYKDFGDEKGSGGASDHQNTIGLELAYSF